MALVRAACERHGKEGSGSPLVGVATPCPLAPRTQKRSLPAPCPAPNIGRPFISAAEKRGWPQGRCRGRVWQESGRAGSLPQRGVRCCLFISAIGAGLIFAKSHLLVAAHAYIVGTRLKRTFQNMEEWIEPLVRAVHRQRPGTLYHLDRTPNDFRYRGVPSRCIAIGPQSRFPSSEFQLPPFGENPTHQM